MKVLVTGFDPFGGETVNAAYEAVKLLPDEIEGNEIIKLEIPTTFSSGFQVVKRAIEEYEPDVVINVGQAGGRCCITIEKVAINLAEARIPDNDGEQPVDKLLVEDGPTAYFTTLPVKKMVNEIRNQEIPCQISYSAGTYVCNSVMYQVLHLAEKNYPNLRAGFIHVPFTEKQALSKPDGTPFMSMELIAKGLEAAIRATVVDIKE